VRFFVDKATDEKQQRATPPSSNPNLENLQYARRHIRWEWAQRGHVLFSLLLTGEIGPTTEYFFIPCPVCTQPTSLRKKMALSVRSHARILNVRQPSAFLLVHKQEANPASRKTVENRGYRFPGAFPAYVLILASKSKPSKDHYGCCQVKSVGAGCDPLPVPNDLVYGAIVGVVRFTGMTTGPHPSPWFDGPPAVAWETDLAFELPQPILDVTGCQSIRFLDSHPSACRIRAGLLRQLPLLFIAGLGLDLPPSSMPPRQKRRRITTEAESSDDDSPGSPGSSGHDHGSDEELRDASCSETETDVPVGSEEENEEDSETEDEGRPDDPPALSPAPVTEAKVPSPPSVARGSSSLPPDWEAQGFLALPLGLDPVQALAFTQLILQGLQRWFVSHLSATTQTALGPALDFTDPEKLRCLVDPDRRKSLPACVAQPSIWGEIKHAFGGGGFALAQVHAAWTKSGCGVPMHLRGLRYMYETLAPAVLRRLDSLFQTPHVLNNFLHLLVKPPSGTALRLHQDSVGPGEALATCLDPAVRTVADYVRLRGSQQLVHLSGGWSSGQTVTLAPLSVGRFLVLLALLHPAHGHPVSRQAPLPAGAWSPGSRCAFPLFFSGWKTHLPVFNRVLRHLAAGTIYRCPDGEDRRWWEALPSGVRGAIASKVPRGRHTPLDLVAIRPAGDGPETAFMAMWPKGWPHGARRTTATPRITVAMNASPTADPVRRSQVRAWLGAVVDRDAAYLRANNRRFETGSAHANPASEATLWPHFADAYLTDRSQFNHLV
jgi:hypothetical protein